MPKKRKNQPKQVRLAIVGTGGMAHQHALAFNEIPAGELLACCDLDGDRARAFAEKHSIPASYNDLEQMLAEAPVDAVSVVTPDASHKLVSLRCLKARKHVLCEKPLAMNARDAATMLRAAEEADIVHMVNLSYRNWPAIQALATLVPAGAIGDLRHVEASYLQGWLVGKQWGDWQTSPAWLWRLSTRHGSNGVLGDLGVHIVDFAAFPAGPIRKVFATLKTFPKAKGNRIGEYRLDANDTAVLNVEFANGAQGIIQTTRWCGGYANRLFLRIAGTAGTVEFDSEHSVEHYCVCSGPDLDTGKWKQVHAPATPTNYQRFIQAIQSRKPEQPDFATGVAVQKVLDAAFRSAVEKKPVRIR